MNQDVATVLPNCSVVDAALKMVEAGISCVLVAERERIAGIVSGIVYWIYRGS